MLECLEKCFLRHIFGVGFVPKNRERHYEDALLIRLDQFVKQLPLAALDTLNKGNFPFMTGV